MGAVLVVGTTVGLIWADTSDLAGAFALVTNLVGIVGVVALLIWLGVIHLSAGRKRQVDPGAR